MSFELFPENCAILVGTYVRQFQTFTQNSFVFRVLYKYIYSALMEKCGINLWLSYLLTCWLSFWGLTADDNNSRLHWLLIFCFSIVCLCCRLAKLRWLRSIVVRPPVLSGELSLSCARLMAGRVTTLWVRRPLSVNQHGQLSQPSLRGRLNDGLRRWRPNSWLIVLPVPVIGALPRAVFGGWAVT